MREFIDAEIASLRATIEAEEWGCFEDAFRAVVTAANNYHVRFDKGFLVWKVSSQPPGDLELKSPAHPT
jgi:hypothetical protein